MTTNAVSLTHALGRILAAVTGPVSPTDVVQDGPKQEALTYEQWVARARDVRTAAEKGSLSPQAKLDLIRLERQEYALKSLSREAPEEPDATVETDMLALRKRYKDQFPNAPEITEFEKRQMRHLCATHPSYARRLVERNNNFPRANDEWTIAFFKFCLRSPAPAAIVDKNATHWIDIFINYPDEADEIMRCHMDKRLGFFPENLKVFIGKGVCLHFDVPDGAGERWISIQGAEQKKQAVPLRNRVNPNLDPLRLTIEQIFEQFRQKTTGYHDVEMCEQGIINWNSIYLGSKDPANPQSPIVPITLEDDPRYPLSAQLAHKFPPVFTLTYEQLLMRHPGQIEKEPLYGLVLRANRLHSDHDANENHALFDAVIPLGDGRYRVIPAGFQSTILPRTLLDRFKFSTATIKGGFHCPDEGHSLTNRAQLAVFYSLTLDEGKELARLVAKEISKCQNGHRYFQPGGKNCAYTIQRIFEQILGDSFYGALGNAAVASRPAEQDRIQRELMEAMKTLDPQDFDKFISPVIQQLVARNDIDHLHPLLEAAVKTLNRLLHLQGRDQIPIPSKDDFAKAVQAASGKENEIVESIKILAKVCMEALHPYKIHTKDVVVKTAVIKHIIRAIRAIPWDWLRTILMKALLFVIGSWRGYRYQKTDGSNKTVHKTARFMHSRHVGTHMHLPSQLFDSYHPDNLKARAQRARVQANILRGAQRTA
jgi:hypothetical protein